VYRPAASIGSLELFAHKLAFCARHFLCVDPCLPWRLARIQMANIEAIDDTWKPAAAPNAAVTLKKPVDGPSMFEVGLASYPVQPWTNRNAKLSQWFNYGLNPATWSKYSLAQIAIYSRYKAASEPAAGASQPASRGLKREATNVDDVLQID
jgi:hypothetical protein